MWKKPKAIINKLLTSILFVAMAMQLSGWYLYSHSHMLADGSVITHTHPYNKGADSSPFKSHVHHDIDQVFSDSLQILVIIFTSLYLFFQIAKSLERFKIEYLVHLEGVSYGPGRSPPSFR